MNITGISYHCSVLEMYDVSFCIRYIANKHTNINKLDIRGWGQEAGCSHLELSV